VGGSSKDEMSVVGYCTVKDGLQVRAAHTDIMTVANQTIRVWHGTQKNGPCP
jgi:hypothetical protein